MKIKFWCHSGANAYSKREEVLDVEKDLGYTEEEWNAMSHTQKYNEAERWAWERLEIGYAIVEE